MLRPNKKFIPSILRLRECFRKGIRKNIRTGRQEKGCKMSFFWQGIAIVIMNLNNYNAYTGSTQEMTY